MGYVYPTQFLTRNFLPKFERNISREQFLWKKKIDRIVGSRGNLQSRENGHILFHLSHFRANGTRLSNSGCGANEVLKIE